MDEKRWVRVCYRCRYVTLLLLLLPAYMLITRYISTNSRASDSYRTHLEEIADYILEDHEDDLPTLMLSGQNPDQETYRRLAALYRSIPTDRVQEIDEALVALVHYRRDMQIGETTLFINTEKGRPLNWEPIFEGNYSNYQPTIARVPELVPVLDYLVSDFRKRASVYRANHLYGPENRPALEGSIEKIRYASQTATMAIEALKGNSVALDIVVRRPPPR